MAITQTVTIPANHRLIIDVPHEVPAGPVILTFTPAPKAPAMSAEQEMELFRLHADELNAEAEDVLLYQNPIFEEDDP